MKDNLKIALLELYYGQSGKLGFYNSQSLGLAKAYVDLGHEVLIVRPEKDQKEISVQKFSEKIMLLTVPAKTLGVHSFYDLNFLIDYQVDLVHLNSDNQAYVPRVIKFCKKNHICLYNYVGTLYSDTNNRIKRKLLAFFTWRNVQCYKKSLTYVKTDAVNQELRNKGVLNVHTVPVGLDFEVIPQITERKEEIRERLQLPKEKRILLYVGRLAEYKRPLDMIEVLNRLDNSYFLVIIGNGELRATLLEKTQEIGAKDSVKYIESIPNKEIHEYYRAADCFLNFNPKEIFGMSILEAMYQECPVVAQHAPGPDCIVQNGKTGYLCSSIEEMCESIMKVDAKMGENGKQRIVEQFSWNAACKVFLEGVIDKR